MSEKFVIRVVGYVPTFRLLQHNSRTTRKGFERIFFMKKYCELYKKLGAAL